MAKKGKKTNIKAVPDVSEDILPQNIVAFGERVEESKNIYISQSAYKAIHKFTEGKITNESGGMLVGNIVEKFGKTNIIISGFVEARFCEATPTTLKFTHETWEYCHKEIDKKYPGKKIVGWIHTHPNFGIFLSEYDKFIQSNFFKEDYQIAYVVDPIQSTEGFYFWINGNIERCKGFFIFDKNGIKITTSDNEKEEKTSNDYYEHNAFSFRNITIAVLAICVAILFFINISLNGRTNKLENQQQTLANSANQSLSVMQQQINSLSKELSDIKNSINDGDDNSNNGTSSQTSSTESEASKNE